MRSQFTTGKYTWSGSPYNGNNIWLYNGTNGCLNNNNKYNGYRVRRLDYDMSELGNCKEFLEFMDEMYDAYYTCRKKKRNKETQLEFEYNFAESFVQLTVTVWYCEYTPSESIAFMLEKPRPREVIAAAFEDRIIQTYFVLRLEPKMEENWFDDNSFSCRKGKGGLKAVNTLKELIYEKTCGYVKDVYVATMDFSAFFMSIDTKWLTEEMTEFIAQNFGEDEKVRYRLQWMARIIYQSLPQEHCVFKTNKIAWIYFNPRKSTIGKTKGIAIGNRTSQLAANFITTFLLDLLRELGYCFVHYTDDTAIIIIDVEKWKRDRPVIERYIKEKMHLEWHPEKRYMQHHTKGVPYLGHKLRYDRILPSNRIAGNFIWKTITAAEKADKSKGWAHSHKERFMQTFNSYCGLLKWCNANRLKNKAFEILKSSKFAKNYDFYGNNKIKIKQQQTVLTHFISINRKRKRRNYESQKTDKTRLD